MTELPVIPQPDMTPRDHYIAAEQLLENES